MDKLSFAEIKSLEATKLDHFAVQISDVRRTVEQILNMFGRGGIFAEYTVHDFSHVTAMLEDLEWIITEPTRSLMTLGDWLMITLAIYFHDMGLVITQAEFDLRGESGFN